MTASPAAPASAGAWTGPALLLPCAVQALPVTNGAYQGAWSWTAPRYSALGVLQQVDPAPFTAQLPAVPGVAKFRGVVVRWTLPDGLTQGIQTGPGVEYPAAPNRWLVVRKQPGSTGWSFSAWIIASDYLSGPAGSPWPNQAGSGATTLGRCWPIAEWPGEAEVSRHAVSPPLTAVGAGDPTFAAFVPNVVNVFSFADQLDDRVRGPLTYSVRGWYSSPALDPLFGAADYGPDGWQTLEQWQALMTRRHWSAGDEAGLADAVAAAQEWAREHGHATGPGPHLRYPARTLCHGLVQDVFWRGVDGPFVSGVPTSNADWPSYVKPQLVVAHSAIDAIAGMIAQAEVADGMPPDKAAQLVDILEAFNLDALPLLDEPDGLAQLTLALQANWFDATGSGTVWELLAPRDTRAPAGQTGQVELSDDQDALLTELNLAQRDLDETQRLLAAGQWERYALWWKDKRLRAWVPPPPDLQAWLDQISRAIPPLQERILGLANRYRLLRQLRDQALVALHGLLGPLTLVAGSRPPYFRPSQPTVLVNGAGRDFAHGEDSRFTPDGTVFCRFTGQAVAGIRVTVGADAVTVTAGDVPPPAWNCPDLPPEAADLDVETFFLDLADAPLIAQISAAKGGSAQPWELLSAIRAEQTLIWNPALHPPIDRQTIAELSGLITQYGLGALPSKLSVDLFAPPWSPLYLDWRFDFYAGGSDQAHALENWELPPGDDSSAPLDEFTYRWLPPAVARANPIGLQGRTLLTPQASRVFAGRLERLIDDAGAAPDTQSRLWALQDALLYVRDADLLSQALTGFDLALLERSPSLFPMPGDHSLDPYLSPPGVPALTPDSTPWPPALTAPPNTFSPLATGHLKLLQLWVVDAFGQVFKVLDPQGGALPPGSAPAMGIDMTTRDAPDLAELKPRVTQFARLRMPLLGATDDLTEVDTTTGVSPVCGWLIPAHLDHAVLVYSSDGDLEGELFLAQDRALWLPPPDRSPPPHGGAPPVTIANPHLRAIVTGVLDHRVNGRADSADALRGLLELLDTAFWSINPAGGWADEELPVLIGRPLAVLRAGLHLDVAGDPAHDQAWPGSGEAVTDGFETVPFPVQLGCTELLDDGLVGFYLNDDYQRINTVYSIRPHGYVGHGRPHVRADRSSRALLTLVLDPRTSAHAISGVLPALRVSLPGVFSTPALGRLAATFRTGPVLSDPGVASMPLPGLRQGAWSWLQYPDPAHDAVQRPVLAPDATAALPGAAPVLREGWLKLLLDGGPTTLTYALDPPVVATTTDPSAPNIALLRLTAYNPTGQPVNCPQIDIAVPAGTGPGELTADPGLLAVSAAAGTQWQVSTDGQGHILATPPGGQPLIDAGTTLTFVIAGVLVNPEPGTCVLTVTEVTEQTRTLPLPLTKLARATLPGGAPARRGQADDLPARTVQLRGHPQRGALPRQRARPRRGDPDDGGDQPDAGAP
jgi:hypothetical protein